MSTKYSLHAIRQKYKETHPGVTDTIDFTVKDEEKARVYHIEHPLLQSNRTKEAVTAAKTDIDMAKAVLGDQWNDFIADGGQVADVMLLMNEIGEQMESTTPDGVPTQR
ncbi:hypothetical protein [Bifidobacterium bombi]|uniref:Uncharacterized protein n=1 Tax=Bifidobacterium bombi DSM 19703 TaxID=1341695 RepID=A0A080N3N1_9BIFI|nr:hypothetical protein [Bifidobacterium bombi]KFF31646.1 hypothetical protein BBOMB_1032 [Bifidobacterium bombi DSM 19703]